MVILITLLKWGRVLSPSRRGWTLTRGRRISSALFKNSKKRQIQLFGKEMYVRSSSFRPIHQGIFWLLLADCLLLGIRLLLCPLRCRVFWLVVGLLLGLILSVESAAAQPIEGDIVMATSEASVNQAAPATSDVAKETGKGSGCCSSLFGCLCSCLSVK